MPTSSTKTLRRIGYVVFGLLFALSVLPTAPTQAAAPGNFNKLSPGNGATNQPIQITFSWDKAAGATRYGYCIASSAACPGQDNGYTSTGSATSVTRILNPNTKYFWQARAYNANGEMMPANGVSGWWSFTTLSISSKTVSNSAVSLTISGQHGGAIDSLKVLGIEVLDNYDMGRMIQASLTFDGGKTQFNYTCPVGSRFAGSTVNSVTINPQEGGDFCDNPSPVYGLNLGPQGSGEINVGTFPRDFAMRGFVPDGLKIEGNHKIGPLPYANFPEAIRLGYNIFSTKTDITMQHQVPLSASTYHPDPYLPAIYFKNTVLTRLFGLQKDGKWVEVTKYVNHDGSYKPVFFKFLAMAWMRQDLGWGVGLYSYRTVGQQCIYNDPSKPYNYPIIMPDPGIQGCPNFEAVMFPSSGVNNLSSLDQTIGTIKKGTSTWRMAHLVVGNQDTIKKIVNTIYASKN